MKAKKSCIIYDYVFDAIGSIKDEAEQARAFKAYISFAMYGEEYSGGSESIQIIIKMAKDKVEAADKKYWAKVERAENAAKARHEQAEERKKAAANSEKGRKRGRAKNMFTETIEKSNTDYDAIAKTRGLPLVETG